MQRYAAAWPRDVRCVAGVSQLPFLCDQVSIAGCSSLALLNGSKGTCPGPIFPSQPTIPQLMGMARQFLLHTGSHGDCMRGMELAMGLAFADPYGNVMPNQLSAGMAGAMVVNYGRSAVVAVPNDNTVGAYLAPFYTNAVGTHVANDMLGMRHTVLAQVLVYYHVTLSQAHAAARLTLNATAAMINAGNADAHCMAMLAKEGPKRNISKFDRLVANTCAHLFGYMPHEDTLLNTAIDPRSLALVSALGMAPVYMQQWIPQQWLGYEICEVMLMMPEGWALTGPGARMQLDPTKGAPCRDRLTKANFVRMYRSLPVIDAHVWLGDGGQAHGAAHLASGHGAHYYLESRGYWRKPYTSQAPASPTYLPLAWVDPVRMPGVLVPGQFPTWDPTEEVNVAWGLRINPNKRSHELVDVLNRQADITTTRAFVCRNGFVADDPTRVLRALPSLRLYNVFADGEEPGSPVATIERNTPELAVTHNMDFVSEANSNEDPVAGIAGEGAPKRGAPARREWVKVSRSGGRKQAGLSQRFRYGSGNGGAAGNNRFAALANSVAGAADASQRAREAVRDTTPTGTAADVMPRVSRSVQSPISVQHGPTDDEMIASAIATADEERRRLQAVGAGPAPPRQSYADAVKQQQDGAAAVDAAAGRGRPAVGKPAVPHQQPSMVERQVDGKPIAVPDVYVAPPSSASGDMLAAVASGALGELPDRLRRQPAKN